jgi:hypothetical protein
MATEHSQHGVGRGGQGVARPAASPPPPLRDRVWHASMRTYMVEALDEEINALDFYALVALGTVGAFGLCARRCFRHAGAEARCGAPLRGTSNVA